jgi:uncharacterized protein YbjT (DUF2867 family)
MKVLVIGATGRTGGIAMRKLLERGDEVTALVRRPDALAQAHERLRVVVGEARDAPSIERAAAGQDAVLSAIGPRTLRKDDLQEIYMRNLVAAMQNAGVKRLSNLSANGVGASYPALPWFAKLIFSTIGRAMMADKARGEAILFASGLDYVNVRPGVLRNGPARGGVKTAATGFLLFINREDLAEFMVEELTDERWVRQSPVVGY